jgi:DNA helicase-2/ATP-dependent DNA helicase PcrA
VFRIFGPPGTGKTTTLLNMVDEALASGISPNKIAFLAFTRKAAHEAKERACERFNLDPQNDFFYFRTLHSLALTLSDIRPEQVMQSENYRELSEILGVTLYIDRPSSDDLPEVLKAHDPILGLINLARLRMVDLRKQYDTSSIEEDWIKVDFVARGLREYKEANGLFDFTDMLEQFSCMDEKYFPKFDLCFLDEAQDLSPLQWKIASLLEKNSKRMYCAGDDDQAIYKWAGADVNHFIFMDGPSETLSQSHRIPKKIHNVAESIVKRIRRRHVKKYEPRGFEGSVQRVWDLSQIDLSEGQWLILAQAGYQLSPVKDVLKSNGLLFDYRGSRSINEKISIAVNAWEDLRKERTISGRDARIMYHYMSVGKGVKRGFKKLSGLEDTDTISFEELTNHFGLLKGLDSIWHMALDKIPEEERAYIIAMLRRGEKFNGIPRISVSTIHGSKGGEADNVVIHTDLSWAAEQSSRLEPDDIHRVFYVGVTRAKQNLFIVEPEDTTRSYDL